MCFVQHRSAAPPACAKAGMAAFKCEHEMDAEEECMGNFGQETMVACRADVMQFCHTELSKGFRPTFDCMMRNQHKISPVCRAESRNLVSCVACKNTQMNTFDLCMETFVKVCKGTKEGDEEKCFRKNVHAFPGSCQRAVMTMTKTCERMVAHDDEMNLENEVRDRVREDRARTAERLTREEINRAEQMRKEGDVMRQTEDSPISALFDLVY